MQSSLNNGISPSDVLSNGLIPGMDLVGEKMESGKMFIPEVLMSAQAMTASVELLKPLLGESDLTSAGKIIFLYTNQPLSPRDNCLT